MKLRKILRVFTGHIRVSSLFIAFYSVDLVVCSLRLSDTTRVLSDFDKSVLETISQQVSRGLWQD